MCVRICVYKCELDLSFILFGSEAIFVGPLFHLYNIRMIHNFGFLLLFCDGTGFRLFFVVLKKNVRHVNIVSFFFCFLGLFCFALGGKIQFIYYRIHFHL